MFNPSVFKAYDVRGLYPSEITEELFHQLGRAFVAYLGPGRYAVTRDMRVSSPSLTKAFIDGAVLQGGTVLDYGLLGTDQMYYAVAADKLNGGAQVTASHNSGEYNGCKMVREEAFPLSGEAGIKEMKEMILANAIPAPKARPARSSGARSWTAISSTCCRLSTSNRSSRSTWCSMPAAAWPASWRRACSTGCPARPRACASRWTARSRTTKPIR